MSRRKKVNVEVDVKAYDTTLQFLALKYGISPKKLLEIVVEDFWKGRILEAEEYRKNGGQVPVEDLFKHCGPVSGDVKRPKLNPEVSAKPEENPVITDTQKYSGPENEKAPWE